MNVHVWAMPARDRGAEGGVGYIFAKFLVCELVGVGLGVAVGAEIVFVVREDFCPGVCE